MKRFLIGFLAILTLLAFFSSTLAIDRTPKESKAKEKEKPAELKEYEKTEVKEGKGKGIISPEKKGEKIKSKTKGEGTVPENLTKWRKSWEKRKAKEKYDYFIDKNNNGIDDRLERKNPKKSISTPAVRPVQKEKQPAKSAPSVKETDKTEKIKEAPKKKEVKKVEKTEGEKRR
jgi:hypothetical protein